MVNKLNATAKLYLLVLVISIFIIGTGVYGIREMKTMHQNTQTLYVGRMFPIEQLTTVRYAYTVGILSTAQQAHSGQLTFGEARKQVLEAEEKIATNWKAYMLTYQIEEEKQLAKQVEELMNQTTQTVEKLKAILDKEDTPALDDILNNDLYGTINPLIAKVNELVNLQIRVGGEVYKNSTNVYDTASKKFFLLIVLSLVFAIPFSHYLVRNVRDLINNLKESNEKIRESEEKYRSLVENAGDPIFLVNEDNTFYDVNESACKLLGYAREEFLRMHIAETFDKEGINKSPLQMELLHRNKELLSDLVLRRKDGHKVDVELNIKVMEGKGYLVIARDITERKRIEETILESERKYRNIFENVQDVFYQTSMDGIILDISPSIKNHLGYTREELIGTPAQNLYYNVAEREKGVNQLRKDGELKDYELCFKSSSDTPVFVALNGRIILGDDGKPSHIDGSYRNITERKMAEKLIRESEERYKSIISVSNTGAWEYHSNSGFLWCSPEYFTMLGREQKEYDMSGNNNLKETWSDLLHPEDRERAANYFAEYLNKGSIGMYESYFRLLHTNGSWIWIWSRGQTLRDANGKLTKITVGTHIDITERKNAEDKIKQSEEKQRALIENISDTIILVNKSYEVFYQSPSFIRTAGFTLSELKGKSVFEYVNPEDLENSRALFQQSISSPRVPLEFQYRILHKNGHYIWIEGNITNLLDDESVKAFTVVYRDITERKKSEDLLKLHNEKLIQIAFLQSHIVRRPIASIFGLINLINKDNPSDPLNFEVIPRLEIMSKELNAAVHQIMENINEISP